VIKKKQSHVKKTPPPAPPKAAVKVPPKMVVKAPPPAQTRALAVSTKSLLMQDAGQGMQGMNPEDFAIPRLAILQPLSPQVNKRDENYLEGAEAGMILDNVSNTLYDGQDGILVVLVSYRRTHLQWWPRDSKGGRGFIKDWGPDSSILSQTIRDEKFRNLLSDGSEIVPTAEYYAFVVDEETGQYERVMIPMARTQLIKAKKLNTVASTLMVPVEGMPRRAPLFFRAYYFRTRPESNEKGNWFGWDIQPGPALLESELDLPVLNGGERIYLEARSFRQAIESGTVRVASPLEDGGVGSANSEDSPM